MAGAVTPGDDREPSVRITLRAIYDEVVATRELVAPLPKLVDDHETRIRILEVFKAKREGAAGLAGGVIYVCGGAVLGFVLNHLIR